MAVAAWTGHAIRMAVSMSADTFAYQTYRRVANIRVTCSCRLWFDRVDPGNTVN